jgi:hypothetical protein
MFIVPGSDSRRRYRIWFGWLVGGAVAWKRDAEDNSVKTVTNWPRLNVKTALIQNSELREKGQSHVFGDSSTVSGAFFRLRTTFIDFK